MVCLFLLHLFVTPPNVEMHRKVAEHIRKYDTLPEIVEKRVGHVERAKGTLANTILRLKSKKKTDEGQQNICWTM